MSKLLVVIGATGKQGGSVISAVLADPKAKAAFTIRGVSRSVDGKGAQALKAQGVEVVAGDLNDKASLVAAFKGAYAVYAVTDYWQGAGMDMQKEIEQGKAIVDAAKENDVQHFILSTLISPKKTTNGALSKVYHFDGKDEIAEYAKSSGLPTTFYLPGFYMSNLPGGMIRKDESSGKYVVSFPSAPDARVPLFDAEKDTGKFVKAALLNREGTLGKQILGAENYYTPAEIASVFEETFPHDGKGTTFQTTPDDLFLQIMKGNGMPDFAAEEMLENMHLLNKEYGYYNNESLDETKSLVSDKLTSWAEFLKAAPAYKDLK